MPYDPKNGLSNLSKKFLDNRYVKEKDVPGIETEVNAQIVENNAVADTAKEQTKNKVADYSDQLNNSSSEVDELDDTVYEHYELGDDRNTFKDNMDILTDKMSEDHIIIDSNIEQGDYVQNIEKIVSAEKQKYRNKAEILDLNSELNTKIKRRIEDMKNYHNTDTNVVARDLPEDYVSNNGYTRLNADYATSYQTETLVVAPKSEVPVASFYDIPVTYRNTELDNSKLGAFVVSLKLRSHSLSIDLNLSTTLLNDSSYGVSILSEGSVTLDDNFELRIYYKISTTAGLGNRIVVTIRNNDNESETMTLTSTVSRILSGNPIDIDPLREEFDHNTYSEYILIGESEFKTIDGFEYGPKNLILSDRASYNADLNNIIFSNNDADSFGRSNVVRITSVDYDRRDIINDEIRSSRKIKSLTEIDGSKLDGDSFCLDTIMKKFDDDFISCDYYNSHFDEVTKVFFLGTSDGLYIINTIDNSTIKRELAGIKINKIKTMTRTLDSGESTVVLFLATDEGFHALSLSDSTYTSKPILTSLTGLYGNDKALKFKDFNTMMTKIVNTTFVVVVEFDDKKLGTQTLIVPSIYSYSEENYIIYNDKIVVLGSENFECDSYLRHVDMSTLDSLAKLGGVTSVTDEDIMSFELEPNERLIENTNTNITGNRSTYSILDMYDNLNLEILKSRKKVYTSLTGVVSIYHSTRDKDKIIIFNSRGDKCIVISYRNKKLAIHDALPEVRVYNSGIFQFSDVTMRGYGQSIVRNNQLYLMDSCNGYIVHVGYEDFEECVYLQYFGKFTPIDYVKFYNYDMSGNDLKDIIYLDKEIYDDDFEAHYLNTSFVLVGPNIMQWHKNATDYDYKETRKLKNMNDKYIKYVNGSILVFDRHTNAYTKFTNVFVDNDTTRERIHMKKSDMVKGDGYGALLYKMLEKAGVKSGQPHKASGFVIIDGKYCPIEEVKTSRPYWSDQSFQSVGSVSLLFDRDMKFGYDDYRYRYSIDSLYNNSNEMLKRHNSTSYTLDYEEYPYKEVYPFSAFNPKHSVTDHGKPLPGWNETMLTGQKTFASEIGINHIEDIWKHEMDTEYRNIGCFPGISLGKPNADEDTKFIQEVMDNIPGKNKYHNPRSEYYPQMNSFIGHTIPYIIEEVNLGLLSMRDMTREYHNPGCVTKSNKLIIPTDNGIIIFDIETMSYEEKCKGAFQLFVDDETLTDRVITKNTDIVTPNPYSDNIGKHVTPPWPTNSNQTTFRPKLVYDENKNILIASINNCFGVSYDEGEHWVLIPDEPINFIKNRNDMTGIMTDATDTSSMYDYDMSILNGKLFLHSFVARTNYHETIGKSWYKYASPLRSMIYYVSLDDICGGDTVFDGLFKNIKSDYIYKQYTASEKFMNINKEDFNFEGAYGDSKVGEAPERVGSFDRFALIDETVSVNSITSALKINSPLAIEYDKMRSFYIVYTGRACQSIGANTITASNSLVHRFNYQVFDEDINSEVIGYTDLRTLLPFRESSESSLSMLLADNVALADIPSICIKLFINEHDGRAYLIGTGENIPALTYVIEILTRKSNGIILNPWDSMSFVLGDDSIIGIGGISATNNTLSQLYDALGYHELDNSGNSIAYYENNTHHTIGTAICGMMVHPITGKTILRTNLSVPMSDEFFDETLSLYGIGYYVLDYSESVNRDTNYNKLKPRLIPISLSKYIMSSMVKTESTGFNNTIENYSRAHYLNRGLFFDSLGNILLMYDDVSALSQGLGNDGWGMGEAVFSRNTIIYKCTKKGPGDIKIMENSIDRHRHEATYKTHFETLSEDNARYIQAFDITVMVDNDNYTASGEGTPVITLYQNPTPIFKNESAPL